MKEKCLACGKIVKDGIRQNISIWDGDIIICNSGQGLLCKECFDSVKALLDMIHTKMIRSEKKLNSPETIGDTPISRVCSRCGELCSVDCVVYRFKKENNL